MEPLTPDMTIRPMDPYCLLFTSGTTGPSKGSLLPHNYAFHTAEVLTDHVEIDSRDRIYTFMPLFHNNAKLAAVVPALMHGCKLVLKDRFSLDNFWQDIRTNENGDFFFLDRSKDSIRRMGENISSMELEGIVNKHPAILENAAIAVPSEYAEDEVKLLVVLKKGAGLEHAELYDYCSIHMARFMVPRYLEFRDELPKNPTGRIEKYKLRKEGASNRTWDGKSREFLHP